MCGRYTVLTEDEIIKVRELIKELSLRIVRDDFEGSYNASGEVFPADCAPVITKSDGAVAFERVRWGFKKLNSSGVIINARSESLCERVTFAKHLQAGRCVIPAGEFFEWEKSGAGKKKHYAKDRHGNLLFMAGLYRNVNGGGGPEETLKEFVIITKKASGEIAKIHDRMPVLLRVEQIEPWLTGKLTPRDIEKMEYDISVNPCDEENTGQISLF